MTWTAVNLQELLRMHYEAGASGINPYPFPLGV